MLERQRWMLELKLNRFGFSDVFNGKRLNGFTGFAWLENEYKTGDYVEMN